MDSSQFAFQKWWPGHSTSVIAGTFSFLGLSCRFPVAEWLTHSPETLEVTGSRPTFSAISESKFYLESIRHRAERGVKWSLVHELTVTRSVSW